MMQQSIFFTLKHGFHAFYVDFFFKGKVDAKTPFKILKRTVFVTKDRQLIPMYQLLHEPSNVQVFSVALFCFKKTGSKADPGRSSGDSPGWVHFTGEPDKNDPFYSAPTT